MPFFVQENVFCRGILSNVNRLGARLRTSGGTVCWGVPGGNTVSEARREFYGDRVAELYAGAGGDGPLRDRLFGDVRPTGDVIRLIDEGAAARTG